MFTGIVKKLSRINRVSHKKESFFVDIALPKGWKVKPGESISISGICSTVKKTGKNIFTVEYMPETIKKTTVGSWKAGTEVNLEKSLRINNLLDGHIVQGHIDTTGKIIEIKKIKGSKVMKIRIPRKFMKLVAEKGSVSVDGISLTVVDAGPDWFTISLVSYTLENTNLGKIKAGEEVNIETDVLAKYIDKIINFNKIHAKRKHRRKNKN